MRTRLVSLAHTGSMSMKIRTCSGSNTGHWHASTTEVLKSIAARKQGSFSKVYYRGINTWDEGSMNPLWDRRRERDFLVSAGGPSRHRVETGKFEQNSSKVGKFVR